MKLSVLMAVYNGERCLEASLDSLLVALPVNSEVIIVNDGSTDGTRELLEQTSDPRLRVLHQENRGVATALNHALGVSHGEYIARLDCGDFCHPDRLHMQLAYLEERPELLLAGCRVRRLDREGQLLGLSEVVTDPARIQRGLMRINLFQHSSIMARRGALEAVGGYRTFFRYAQDLDLFLRLSELGPLGNLPEALSDWRLDPDGISFRWRGRQAAFAELARQCAACRRAGEMDPVDAGQLAEPADVKESPEIASAMYHLESARSALMGGQTRRARTELALAGAAGVPMSRRCMLYGFSLLPSPVRNLARNLRVRWLCR